MTTNTARKTALHLVHDVTLMLNTKIAKRSSLRECDWDDLIDAVVDTLSGAPESVLFDAELSNIVQYENVELVIKAEVDGERLVGENVEEQITALVRAINDRLYAGMIARVDDYRVTIINQ